MYVIVLYNPAKSEKIHRAVLKKIKKPSFFKLIPDSDVTFLHLYGILHSFKISEKSLELFLRKTITDGHADGHNIDN